MQLLQLLQLLYFYCNKISIMHRSGLHPMIFFLNFLTSNCEKLCHFGPQYSFLFSLNICSFFPLFLAHGIPLCSFPGCILFIENLFLMRCKSSSIISLSLCLLPYSDLMLFFSFSCPLVMGRATGRACKARPPGGLLPGPARPKPDPKSP